jgi:hypothetical protein
MPDEMSIEHRSNGALSGRLSPTSPAYFLTLSEETQKVYLRSIQIMVKEQQARYKRINILELSLSLMPQTLIYIAFIFAFYLYGEFVNRSPSEESLSIKQLVLRVFTILWGSSLILKLISFFVGRLILRQQWKELR